MTLRTLLVCALLFPAAAFAGGTARLSAVDANGRQVTATVEYAGDNLRASSPNLKYGYLLARGGKIYNVASINGQPVIMDAADMMRVAGASMPSPTAAIEEVKAVQSLDATGRHETIAGINGTVYILAYEDGRGAKRTEELVLAKDPRASEFTAAAVRLGKTLSTMAGTLIPAGADDLVARIQGAGQGLLRFGSRFQLVSIDGTSPQASRFNLPSGSIQLPDLGGMFQAPANGNR